MDGITVSRQRACELTSLGMTKLNELIQAGDIISTKCGRRRLIYFDSINAYLRKNISSIYQ